MKPPLWRQDRALYPFMWQIQSRYHDQDPQQHINNIALALYFDESRSRFLRERIRVSGPQERTRILTVDSRVSYLSEVFYPAAVDVGVGVLRVGGSSFEVAHAMYQQDRCVGISTATLVRSEHDGARPLEPWLRAALEGQMIVQPALADS